VVLVYREDLREHNVMSQEIVAAMANSGGQELIDEGELDEELELLQQEQLDEQILKTGNVPVSDAVHKLPTAATTERKCQHAAIATTQKSSLTRQIKQSCPQENSLWRMMQKQSWKSFVLRWQCKSIAATPTLDFLMAPWITLLAANTLNLVVAFVALD
jgi:hypothetical protein